MDFCVYSKTLAYYLRTQGFQIKKTAPNYKQPEEDVYYFENTEELSKAVKSYISKCSNDSFTAKKFAKVEGDDTDRVLVIK